ncbi:hypothetical protein, partial [Methanobrevibacter sp.]
DSFIDSVVAKELDNGIKKHISKIDQNVNFRYNSFNICVGPQGSSKTTSVMKELMKLSMVPHDYHMMIYVTDNESDDTFNSLLKYIDIACVKTDYAHVDEQFEILAKYKDDYNAMVDGRMPKDDAILEALCIDDFSKQRIHTFILFDDASFIFDNKTKSKFKSWFTKLRHLNCTVFACIQIWGSLDPKIKTQLSSVYLYKGFSRERLQYIYRQLPIDMGFEQFYQQYQQLPKYKKIVIDCLDSTLKVV